MNHPLDLLNAYLDGKMLAEDEARHLSDWVLADPTNAVAVVELGVVHEHLDCVHSVPLLLEQLAGATNFDVKESISASLQLVEETPGRAAAPGATKPVASAVSIAYFATAACVLLAVGGLAFSLFSGPAEAPIARRPAPTPNIEAPRPAQPVVLATITESLGVKWNLRRRPYRGVQLVEGERIELAEGMLALTTNSGCDLLLQAPATAVLESGVKLRLLSGKLTARAEGIAEGFTVDTPTAQVLDLGTEFGVHVSDDRQTYVAVYEGEVELSSLADDTAEAKSIAAGRSGHVNATGGIRGTVEVLPNDREFVRFDELDAIRESSNGSRDAQQLVCLYELQRTRRLLGFHGFDIPSEGAAFSLAFDPSPVRTKTTPAYVRDLNKCRLYTSGAIEVAEGDRFYLDLDTSTDSPLTRAGLLTKRGHVGRSDCELWIAWRSRALDPSRVGDFAGVSLMFGNKQMMQEPLFVGVTDNSPDLSLVSNVGSRVTQKALDTTPESWPIDPMPLSDHTHLWLVRLNFGERADKVSVWCDVPPRKAAGTLPQAEIANANVFFDRICLSVGRGGASWQFDDILIGQDANAIADAIELLGAGE